MCVCLCACVCVCMWVFQEIVMTTRQSSGFYHPLLMGKCREQLFSLSSDDIVLYIELPLTPVAQPVMHIHTCHARTHTRIHTCRFHSPKHIPLQLSPQRRRTYVLGNNLICQVPCLARESPLYNSYNAITFTLVKARLQGQSRQTGIQSLS